jgi:hypothetical protein
VLDLAAVCGGEPGRAVTSRARIREWLDGALPETRLKESFAGLLDWFAEQFVLYALLPPDGRRRVIKFSYLEPSIPPWQLGAVLARSLRTAGEADPAAAGGGLLVAVRRGLAAAGRNAGATLVQRLGWAPAILEIPAVSVGWGRSYHLEVHAPAELETVESELVVTGPEGAATVVAGRSDGASTHILTGRVDAWSRGRAFVSIQVPRLGLLRTAAVLTLLSTVFFAAMTPLVGQLVEDEAGMRTAPIILGAVGVLVGALSRPGEHALAADMLRLRRAMLLAVGVLYGIGAIALLVADAAAAMTRLWWLLTIVCAALTALLGASFVRARPAARGRIDPG